MIGNSNECPHAEALSALIDGELSASERERIAAHAAACPVCGATLSRFVELRNAFSSIGDADPGVDIAALV
jgi:anti-sigma factor RsiW